MKNYLYFLKNITLVLAVVIVISCQKSDPEPPLAEQVMGEYVATSYTVGNSSLNLPATSNTGLTISGKSPVQKSVKMWQILCWYLIRPLAE